MQLSIIAAVGRNLQHGLKGDLPWKLHGDLANFKKITMGHPIVMGRKTYESIGRPLPGRKNIVVSSSMEQQHGITVVKSLTEAMSCCSEQEQLFVIGGARLYQEALEKAHYLHITQVEYQGAADAFFPEWSHLSWQKIGSPIQSQTKDGYLSWLYQGFERI